MFDDPSKVINPRAGGFALAASVAFIASTLLVWTKETFPALKSAMASALGHHWTTHGIFIVLLFIALGLIFSEMPFVRRISVGALVTLLVISAALSAVGIAGFFLFK